MGVGSPIARILVASSTEALPLARAMCAHFEEERDMRGFVWKDIGFVLNEATLVTLEEQVSQYQYGVFLFHPDDVLDRRAVALPAPRDNVVFELGLFLGRHGRKRCCAVCPREVNLHLPTDLAGISLAHYTPPTRPEDARAAMAEAAQMIARHVRAEVVAEFSLPARHDDEFELLERLCELAAQGPESSVSAVVDLLMLLQRPGGLISRHCNEASLLVGHLARLRANSWAVRTLRDVACLASPVQGPAVLELGLHFFARGEYDRLRDLYATCCPDRSTPFACCLGNLLTVATGTPDASRAPSRSCRSERLDRYTAICSGMSCLISRDWDGFEQGWNLAKDRVDSPLDPSTYPLLGLACRFDHLFVNSIIASDDSQSSKHIGALSHRLATERLLGQGRLFVRVAQRMRNSPAALEALEDFAAGAEGTRVKWNHPMTRRQITSRLRAIETAIWTWAKG